MITDPRNLRIVRAWLFTLWTAVWLMVVIGGITRLTGSGLSIVEWRPVTGALPPLTHAAWQQAFEAYQRSPQYRLANHWMSLSDFQRIFFWEYVHRLWGRVLGLACLGPWLWLVLSKRLGGAQARRTGSILLLGGLQGAVGWYMVASGLVHEPQVSHYRLALHLLLGIGVGQWILWQALQTSALLAPATRATDPAAVPASLRRLSLWLLPLLALQVTYGAFVAGMHAGFLSATFPDMNGHYLPSAFFISGSPLHEAVSSPLAVHYLHRVLAGLVSVHIGVLCYRARRAPRAVRVRCMLLLGALLLQLLLGVLTVVLHVPTLLAAAHQAGAYLLVSAALGLWHSFNATAEARDDSQARDRDGGLAGSRQDLRRA
ncbi:MAG TPA: COX15/CtaA family protein [Polyangiales bacterium]